MKEPRGRPFAAGNTAGRGRPKGSRNKASSVGQDLLDRFAPHLMGKCIERALKSDDRSAMRICMDRIRRRAGRFDPRELPRIRTAQDWKRRRRK